MNTNHLTSFGATQITKESARSQLIVELNRTGVCTENLEKVVAELENRLYPILVSGGEMMAACASESLPRPVLVQFASDMYTENEKLTVIENRLHSILARLQL